jgi:hypothetical protein
MNINRKHIVFKVLTICMVFTLMFPSAFKLAHVFEHHEHEICIGGDTTHIHQVDLDCEFHKFQLNNNFTFSTTIIELFQVSETSSEIISQYSCLSKYQRLHFSLRGPPSLV